MPTITEEVSSYANKVNGYKRVFVSYALYVLSVIETPKIDPKKSYAYSKLLWAMDRVARYLETELKKKKTEEKISNRNKFSVKKEQKRKEKEEYDKMQDSVWAKSFAEQWKNNQLELINQIYLLALQNKISIFQNKRSLQNTNRIYDELQKKEIDTIQILLDTTMIEMAREDGLLLSKKLNPTDSIKEYAKNTKSNIFSFKNKLFLSSNKIDKVNKQQEHDSTSYLDNIFKKNYDETLIWTNKIGKCIRETHWQLEGLVFRWDTPPTTVNRLGKRYTSFFCEMNCTCSCSQNNLNKPASKKTIFYAKKWSFAKYQYLDFFYRFYIFVSIKKTKIIAFFRLISIKKIKSNRL